MELTPPDLSAQASISPSYAWEILNGKRKPSRPLAIHIYRKTGWRHESIAGLNDRQMRTFEEVEPWTPSRDRAA